MGVPDGSPPAQQDAPSGWVERLNAAKRRIRSEIKLGEWTKYGFGETRHQEFKALQACTSIGSLPVESYHNLSVEDFWSRYERQRLPCIISGAPEAEGWPAHQWTFASLFKHLGNVEFKVGKDDSGRTVTVQLRDFEAYMQTDCQGDDSPLYVFESRFRGEAAKLLDQFRPPKYFPDDLMGVRERDRPPYRWFGLGPARSGTVMHQDPLETSAWNTVICGHKLWLLFPPQTPRWLAKAKREMGDDDDDEAINHFLDLLPRQQQKYQNNAGNADADNKYFHPVVCVQGPGDTIFVPGNWWHCVLNLDDTIAVTQNYCGRNNLVQVWRSTRTERPCWCHRWLSSMPADAARIVLELNKKDGFDMDQTLVHNHARRLKQHERRDARAAKRRAAQARARNEDFDEELWLQLQRSKRDIHAGSSESTVTTTTSSSSSLTNTSDSSDSSSE